MSLYKMTASTRIIKEPNHLKEQLLFTLVAHPALTLSAEGPQLVLLIHLVQPMGNKTTIPKTVPFRTSVSRKRNTLRASIQAKPRVAAFKLSARGVR